MRIEKVNIKRVFVKGESVKDYLINLYGDNYMYCCWERNPSKTLLTNFIKLKLVKVSWWVNKKFTIKEFKGVTIIKMESNSSKANIKAYHFDSKYLKTVMEELNDCTRN